MRRETNKRRAPGWHRRIAGLAAVGCGVIALAGCGSSSSSSSAPAATSSSATTSTTSTATAAGTSSASGGGGGLAYAQRQVAKYSAPVTNFPAPGPALKSVASLKGKTVYYVPITLEDPEFSIVAAALKQALGKVGVSVVSCSGNATPSGVSSCLGRAVTQKAAAVIGDSVPIVLAANAFAKVQAAGIPVLITDQLPPPPGLPGVVKGLGTDKLAYQPENGIAPLALIADWVITDSGGKANVLISEFTDSPSTQAYIAEGAQAQFTKNCSGCTVAISKVQNANFSLIPSQTSSALLSHPNTDYVIAEFDAELQPLFGGVQQAHFATKAKGASTTGVLGALQQLKSKQFLAADAGTDFPYQGWADADAVMRQLLGLPIVAERVPMRLFTSANIGSLALTPAAEASGAWYGSSAYQAMFTKLWGK
jgi:ribose transport system substrate-binding protein